MSEYDVSVSLDDRDVRKGDVNVNLARSEDELRHRCPCPEQQTVDSRAPGLSNLSDSFSKLKFHGSKSGPYTIGLDETFQSWHDRYPIITGGAAERVVQPINDSAHKGRVSLLRRLVSTSVSSVHRNGSCCASSSTPPVTTTASSSPSSTPHVRGAAVLNRSPANSNSRFGSPTRQPPESGDPGVRRLPSSSFVAFVVNFSQVLLALFSCAALCGLIATVINVNAEYFADLKFGFCWPWFWLSSSFCCVDRPSLQCTAWQTWSQMFGLRDPDLFSYRALNFFMYLGFALIFAVFTGYLVREYSRFAVGAGIAEVRAILSGMGHPGYLGGWTLVVKSLGMIFGTSSGLSIGKLGPFVHISACISNILSRVFPKYSLSEVKRRELIWDSVATSMAIAFGAPIGGVLFSLEVLSFKIQGRKLWRSFFCSVVAYVILQWTTVGTNGHGKYVGVQLKSQRKWFWFQLLPLIFVGSLCGLVGHCFTHWNLYCVKLRRTAKVFGKYEVKNFPLVDIFVWTIITTLVHYPTPFLREPMSRIVGYLFSSCSELTGTTYSYLCDADQVWENVGWLFLAGMLKFILVSLTFSLKIPAGYFGPALMSGACFGRMVGCVLQSYYLRDFLSPYFNECNGDPGCVNPGLFAMAGSISMLGGISRMTISLAVIMVEVAGSFDYFLPMMIAIVSSNLTIDALGRLTIYDLAVDLNEYPFMDAQRKYHAEGTVRNILDYLAGNGLPKRKPVVELIPLQPLTSTPDPMPGTTDSGIVSHPEGLASSNSDGQGIFIEGVGRVTLDSETPIVAPAIVSFSSSNCTIGQVLATLSSAVYANYPVVRSSLHHPVVMIGYLERNLLMKSLKDLIDSQNGSKLSENTLCTFVETDSTDLCPECVDVSACVSKDFTTVSLDNSVAYLTKLFQGVAMRWVVVVDTEGRLTGIITRRDLVRFLRSVESKHFGNVHSLASRDRTGRVVPVARFHESNMNGGLSAPSHL